MSSDWYLDPPEYDDGPQCPHCDDGYGEIQESTGLGDVYKCEECGFVFVDFVDPYDGYIPEELEEMASMNAEANRLCPHGREWSECNACMVAGDIAYDATREARYFGRWK